MSTTPSLSLKYLVNLLNNAECPARLEGNDAQISGMTVDSREVAPSCLFVCKGAAFRPAFLASAIDAGAAAYLCDESLVESLAEAGGNTPRIVASDVRHAMALAAAAAYGNPDERLNIIGITGTKGKSTTAYMLRSIFTAAGVDTSILGSIETDDGMEHYESHNTTPEAPELWRHLRNTEEAGRGIMVMEVSSHGLKYDRVLGLHLGTACFLNIGRDHISPVEHSDFEDYFSSKLRIFEQCRTAVVNLDTDHAERVLDATRAAERIVTFGIERDDAGYQARNIETSTHGISFDLVAEGETRAFTLGMAGAFNVSNALAAIVMARIAGIGFDSIAEGLAHVRVPGRMELVASADENTVCIVDYAHNELSFETLFSSVAREYPGRKVIAVFGAPGGKAVERRECLPRVAGRYADLIVYTEEDPAHERVEDICAELAANTPEGVAHEEIYDREAAVQRAFEAAQSEPSVVLLLAKGDETTQHRGDDYPEVKSDLAMAREILGA
ncbi:MAG: UDP-N-acetylmuramoyl-L-alanyl-D-glutamate--2,6-diaminopimelate ligase [Slackia sp.]|nr:UDP-N-acetylmuramoyl-L-alanyl-D-glutamate--2,6-diaminopimelate ligase [Slackia sp.]